MSVYVVTYDLNKEVHRPNITGAIKSSFPWALLSESCYAISTNLTPDDVFDQLKPLIDENDSLFVIPLRRPFAGFGAEEVIDWLEARLR